MGKLKYFLLILILLLFGGCGQNNPLGGGDDPGDEDALHFGGEHTLEIATWNIENFPKKGGTTIEKVRYIIEESDIDMIAVQEIADTHSFRELVAQLPEYNGLYSQDYYDQGNYQKTGLIYKKTMITIKSQSQLFPDNDWAFPRPPLLLEVEAEKGDSLFDFNLINIHLKAFGGDDNLERRREAAESLKTYMDERIATETEKDYIVVGDWNDEIDDPPEENAFTVFLDDSTGYKFLTEELAGNYYYASYPSYGSLIDHILISADCMEEYEGGTTTTLRLDDYIIDYFDTVSDHRPVMATFPVF